MISKLLLFILILPISAQAFDKDFTAMSDRVPLEFTHLFNSLKMGIKTPAEKIQMVGICKDLDENLGQLQKEHIFLLMKSEVIKNVLEYKFKKVRQFDMTLLLLDRLEEDFKNKERYLNSFSQWIWRSILAELRYRQDMGLITARTFDANQFDGAKKSEAQRFARYLTYLMPWIDRMDSLTAPEFNNLSKQVSWVILRRLNERSLLFKRYASTATSNTKITIFNIPQKLLELHPEDIKRMQQNEVPLTLKEESEKAKTEATKQVQDVTPEDLSPLSDEINEELNKKIP
ncbi:hypothetical protein [Peredibacter starrii]|uniref:Uncharacterized protein n=1 Tax=Peredibacter starrii TaxID=28202 RepID=A0AAX4HRL9_9BACT|nr:hypothetical protein [Peredibacter starrii]WPU65731.1 hypothetical protein SOO65_03130 [Peredibacter starrii]